MNFIALLAKTILEKMLCACSGEQFKFEEPPQSPESLATRDFSASCLSSRTGDWDLKFEDSQVDEVESTLKEALSLNYEVRSFLFSNLFDQINSSFLDFLASSHRLIRYILSTFKLGSQSFTGEA